MPAFRRPARPPVTGEGSLTCARINQPVSYSISTSDALKSGKGSVKGDVDHMGAAFLEGRASLMLDSGQALPVMFVGYTRGSDTAYFEITRR